MAAIGGIRHSQDVEVDNLRVLSRAYQSIFEFPIKRRGDSCYCHTAFQSILS